MTFLDHLRRGRTSIGRFDRAQEDAGAREVLLACAAAYSTLAGIRATDISGCAS